MQLGIVAEGIERPDQLDRLIELGCPLGQGFLLSRPLDVDQATEFLARRDLGVARRHVERPSRATSGAGASLSP